MSDTESSSGDEEEVMMSEPAKCLFCKSILPNVEECISHCQVEHDFNLCEMRDRHRLDFYGYMKLINYIRKNKPSPASILTTPSSKWDSEEYLTPTDANDPLLWHELPGVFQSEQTYEPLEVNKDDGKITISSDHYSHLQSTIEELTNQIKELKLKYDGVVKLLGESKEDDVRPISTNDYFDSYSDCAIHREMIKDDVRTSSYKSALFKNRELVEGKVVMDVGCGTGILSFFAAQAGAERVIAIDNANIIKVAERISKANGFEKKVEFIQSKLEEVTLPVPQVDVIVSEWMGYSLLFEGMLDSVLYARDKFLRPGGLILPNQARLHMCCVSDTKKYYDLISCWNDMYGLKMSELEFDCKDALVEDVVSDAVCTDTATLHEYDLNSCTKEDTEFNSKFSLHVLEKRVITAFCLYFDIDFQLPYPVSFSTSPTSQPTHWRQCLLCLKEPLKVSKGEKITGEIGFSRPAESSREYQIYLKYGDNNLLYTLK